MRKASLPVIADYTSRWQRPLMRALRVDLEPTVAPESFTGRSGETVARVRFRQAAWPGVDVVEPWRPAIAGASLDVSIGCRFAVGHALQRGERIDPRRVKREQQIEADQLRDL